MAITLSLGVAALVLLPPRETLGEAGTRTVSVSRRVGSEAPTSELRRYFDARGRSRSLAVGRPTRGFLRNAVGLDDSSSVYLKRSSLDHRYGTYELVSAIRTVADSVSVAFPGSRLTVGDISRRSGGRIRPHRSHRRGLDADVGFFVTSADGEPAATREFVRMDAEGADVTGSGLRFDVARNWALVVALLEQEHARVQYIIVWRAIEQMLLEHAQSIGAPPELVSAATEALYQPSRGSRHDNHFHVRFYCPVDDRPQCQDSPPFHPWFDRGESDDAPARAGVRDEAKR